MASDSRALTLKLLADTADFQKKLADGSKDIDSIGERAAEFGKKAAIAFAAAGAAIGAFAISAVKAAAEDETAQLKLAATIKATTGATADQIKGIERYITQTSISIGITDDELRPAFSRLVRSTQDVEEAQKLLNLALDLASATGKPLETVTNALGKAYDGNTTALGKLGLGLDDADLKGKDLDTIFQELTSTFGNFAENESESTAKQMERVKIALDEAKESIGAALLPVVQELTAWILENFIPALEAFISGLTGSDGLTEGLTETEEKAVQLGKKVRGFIDTVIDLKDELIVLGAVMVGVFAVNKIAAGVAAIIILIDNLKKAYNFLKKSALIAGVAQAFALNPLLGLGAVALAAGVLALANKTFGGDDASGGSSDLFFPGGGTGGKGRSDEDNFDPNAPVNVDGVNYSSYAAYKASKGGGKKTLIEEVNKDGEKKTLIEEVSERNFLKRQRENAFDTSKFRRGEEKDRIIGPDTPISDVGKFRRGEEKDRVTININGAIDPASTARQIADLLNNEASVSGSFNNLGQSRFTTRIA